MAAPSDELEIAGHLRLVTSVSPNWLIGTLYNVLCFRYDAPDSALQALALSIGETADQQIGHEGGLFKNWTAVVLPRGRSVVIIWDNPANSGRMTALHVNDQSPLVMSVCGISVSLLVLQALEMPGSSIQPSYQLCQATL